MNIVKIRTIYNRSCYIDEDDLKTGKTLIPLCSNRKQCKVSMLRYPPSVTMIAVRNIAAVLK